MSRKRPSAGPQLVRQWKTFLVLSRPMTVSEVAKKTGAPLEVARRDLMVLESAGLVSRAPDPGHLQRQTWVRLVTLPP